MNIMLYLHSGSMNRGCEALARSAASIVKMESGLKDTHLYLSSFLPESDRHLKDFEGIYDMNPKPVGKMTVDYLIAAINLKLLKSESYSIRKSNKDFISRISDMDVYLSIGGDVYCYGEQPIWYELNRNIHRHGKKMVLWGCSIGKEDLSPAKIEDLKLYDLILARESLTYDLLKSKGLDKVKLVADGAFLLEKEELPLPEGWVEGNTIGLNFSPLVYKKNPAARDAFDKLIKHILGSTDLQIAFTPHVTEHNNNDYEILNDFHELYKNTGRTLILPDNLNALQYKGYIARMRFFIGARTHATIAAYSNCVPTMVLGYSVKSKGIARGLFGEEKLVLTLQEISDSEKMISKFDEMLRDENQLRDKLTSVMPDVRKKSADAGKFLAELINSR